MYRIKIARLFPELEREGGIVWDTEGMNVFVPDREIQLDMVCHANGQYNYTLAGQLQTLPNYEPAYEFVDIPAKVKDLETGLRYNVFVGCHIIKRYRVN